MLDTEIVIVDAQGRSGFQKLQRAIGKIVPVRLNDEEVRLFTKAADKSEHKRYPLGFVTLREAALSPDIRAH